MPRCILPYLKVRLSEDNAKGKFMKQRYFFGSYGFISIFALCFFY